MVEGSSKEITGYYDQKKAPKSMEWKTTNDYKRMKRVYIKYKHIRVC